MGASNGDTIELVLNTDLRPTFGGIIVGPGVGACLFGHLTHWYTASTFGIWRVYSSASSPLRRGDRSQSWRRAIGIDRSPRFDRTDHRAR